MAMKKFDFNLPRPMLVGTTYRFWLSELLYEKARLLAHSMGKEPPVYIRPDDDVLVTSERVAHDLGLSRRTLTRRIKEFRDNEPSEEAAE